MSQWYGQLGKVYRKRQPMRGAMSVGKRALVVATPARNMRARTVAAGLGLRNRAPRAAIKGAIAVYGGQKELKYVDVATADYAGDTTGSVTALNLIAVGDDNTTRDGRQVMIKSLQVRGIVKSQDNHVNAGGARIIFVWDNANNSGGIATIAQIMTAVNANSFPLVDNANRFTILSDQYYAMGAYNTTATTATSAAPFPVSLYKKINQITQYSGTTAAIGSIQNGALLMVTVGTQAAADGATFSVATRVRFTDM